MKSDYDFSKGAGRMQYVKPSPIRAVLEKAMLMRAQGLPVIALSAGEPDFNTPTDIKEETAKALADNMTHYASNRGLPELRTALREYIRRETGTDYDPESEILVTSSGAEALNNAFLALIGEGDEVIIPTPAFVSYKTLTEMCGGKFVDFPLYAENGFEIDLAALEEKITERTKMLVLNSPCNPTGVVYSEETLAGLCALAKKYNFLIFADEIYSRLTYDGAAFRSVASFPDMKEHCIVMSGFSKAFAMTGWRMGYVAASAPLISLMLRVHQYSTTCAPTFLQAGAARGMMTERTEREVAEMVNAFARRRKLLMDCLDQIPQLRYVVPKGAFYMMVDVSGTGMTGQEFAMQLLGEKYVATVPAVGLGDSVKDFIRISYATSDENITAGLGRIGEFVNSLL